MTVTPNFNFAGYCEEALNLYKKAFYAKIGCILRYSDVNRKDWDMDCSKEQEHYIYHSELFIGNQRILMSDDIVNNFASNFSLSLTVTFKTKEEVERAYDVLKEDSVTMIPKHSTTECSCCVKFIDKFGFCWMLMAERGEGDLKIRD